MLYHYRPQTKFAKVMFLQVSVCTQGGHAWQGRGVCVGGGMHGRGACVEGGMCGGGGHAWQGACMARGGSCMAGGMHGGGGMRGRACMPPPQLPPPPADTMRYGQ